jgi:predicted nucleotidyltransferase
MGRTRGGWFAGAEVFIEKPPNGGNVVASMSSTSAQIDLRRLRARREEILGSAAEHGARNVRVFGSMVRGESDASSDVDLLVEMEPGRSLIDLVGLWQDLEDMLGTHVDVLSDRGVSPHLRERIYAEAVSL